MVNHAAKLRFVKLLVKPALREQRILRALFAMRPVIMQDSSPTTEDSTMAANTGINCSQ